MKSRALKYLAAIVFVFVVFLTAIAGYWKNTGTHEYFKSFAAPQSRDVVTGTRTYFVSQKLDGSNSLSAGVPDSVLASESGVISYITNGRAEAAEYFTILPGVFLFSLVFFFLPDGRPWSAVRSISMDFQEYSMRQIQILQSGDGKKRLFSY